MTRERSDRRLGEIFEWNTPLEEQQENFRKRFRTFIGEAMLRRAEADLVHHGEQGHRVRAYVAWRKVEKMRRELRIETQRGPDTGDRVVSYLQLGART